MKSAVGAVVALALGIGLAAGAGATGMNRQAMQSPNVQSGSTEQIQQKQIRPQRQATRQLRHKRVAVQKLGKTRMAALKRHSRMQVARLHRKAQKTRIAAQHRRNQQQNQAVGVGSSMPNNGNTNITQPSQNSAGGTQNLNSTQPQNK